MRLTAPLAALAPCALAWAGELAAQGTCQPQWTPALGGLPGVDGAVYALACFDDGSGPALYVGGDFEHAGGQPAQNVARWDGERWSPLASGLGTEIFFVAALAVYDDGGGPALYAGGYFPNAGEVTTSNIARWTGTGWAPLGSGLNNSVHALAVYDDGRGPALFAGGFLTSASSTSVRHVARWDGTSWSPLGSGTSDVVYALTVHDDGRGPALFAGGVFTSAGGVAANRVARWDGSQWSRVGSGLNERVAALRVFDDGSGPALFAAGAFDRSGQAEVQRIARWNGASWGALGLGLSSRGVPAAHAEALAVYDDGGGPALHVAGRFTRAGATTVNGIARWSGAGWSALAGGLDFPPGVLGSAFVLGEYDGGVGPELVVGGLIDGAGGARAHGIARWNGARWAPPGSGVNDEVAALLVVDDAVAGGQVLYAGGSFTNLGGAEASRIARASAGRWSALAAGLDGEVLALALHDAGDGAGALLHAGGAFTTAGGAPANRVARWDGASWAPLGAGTDGAVQALESLDDGGGPDLFAGGAFASAGGVPALGIARWNGAAWAPLASGLAGAVSDLAVLDLGGGPALFAGGAFERTGSGLVVNHVARWDGTGWTPLADGLDAPVRALACFDDRSGAGPALYAAGEFTSASGVPAARVARWDGARWTALAGGLDEAALTLGVYDDGGGPALFAGGLFALAGGGPARCLARWDGARWQPLGSGTSGAVRALAVLESLGRGGPALIAGGAFTSAPDSMDAFLARWRGCPDTLAPVLHHPNAVVVPDPRSGSPGEFVSFTVTATDERDPFPSVVCVPPSGSFFPPGVTLVQCKASDAARNQASASFPVTVRRKDSR